MAKQMSEGEKDQGIKIVDKRRFSDDGAERQENQSESSKGQAALQKPQTASGKTGGQSLAGSLADGGTAESRTAAAGASSDDSAKRQLGGGPAVNFNNFVLGLGTQALVLMGEIPNPETGLVNANLSAAKQTIDILGMLEDKTKGNLDEDEATLLTEVLSSLRLAFVNRLNSK